MFSIRNGRGISMGMALRGLLLGASPMLLAVGGCEINKEPPSTVSKVSTAPLIIDRATEIRDAEPQTAWYANGSAIAGGTGFIFKPSDKVPPPVRRLTDAPVAALNDVTLPVGVFINPPWEKMVYSGEAVPPTYNAMPPLPGNEPTIAPPAAPAPVESAPEESTSGEPAPAESAPIESTPAPSTSAEQPSQSPAAATDESTPAPVVQPSTAPQTTEPYSQE